MNAKSTIASSALSVKEFRSTALKNFFAHVSLIFLFVVYVNSDYKNHPYSFEIILGFVALAAGVTAFGLRPGHHQRRFKDIYPDHDLKFYILIGMVFIPVLFLMFTIFLCFKEKSSKDRPLRIFIHGPSYAALMFVFFATQIASTKWAFWSASPSTYYIISTGRSVNDVMELKKSNGAESIFDSYSKQKASKLSTTEIVLLSASITSQVTIKMQRSIASGELNKLDSSFIHGIILLKELSKITKASEAPGINLFDFGPAQWLSPVGIIEIFLLSAIDYQIRNNINKTMAQKLTEIVATIENKLSQQPSSVQALYRDDFIKVKKDLNSSKIFRTLASGK